MDIIDFLKTENARLSYGDRWMVWDDAWVVYQRKFGQRKTRELVRTGNLAAALAILKGD